MLNFSKKQLETALIHIAQTNGILPSDDWAKVTDKDYRLILKLGVKHKMLDPRAVQLYELRQQRLKEEVKERQKREAKRQKLLSKEVTWYEHID